MFSVDETGVQLVSLFAQHVLLEQVRCVRCGFAGGMLRRGTRWSSAGAAGAGSLGYGTACFATVVTLTNVLIVIPAVQSPA